MPIFNKTYHQRNELLELFIFGHIIKILPSIRGHILYLLGVLFWPKKPPPV